MSQGTRNYLHRLFTLSPLRHGYLMNAASTCWKQGCVPREQSLGIQRYGIMLHGIHHHLHHTLRIMVGHRQALIFQAQLASHGRTHTIPVQVLALYLCRMHDFQSQGVEHGLVLLLEAEHRYPAQQLSPQHIHFCQGVAETSIVPSHARPILLLPNIRCRSSHDCLF